MTRKSWLVLIVLGLIVTGLAACGPRDTVGVATEKPGGFMVDLPRFFVQYDDNGEPSIGGVRLSDVERSVGMNLAFLRIPSAYIAWLKAANIQHIEFVENGKGVFVFVNGKLLPYIAWDAESLSNTGMVLDILNVPQGALIKKVLPLIQRLGVGLVLQFPVAEGKEVIPVRAPEDLEAQLVTRDKVLKRLQEYPVPLAKVTVRVPIQYDENGVPSIEGLSAEELMQLGVDVTPVLLPKSTIQFMQDKNIQHISLVHKAEGIFIYLNNRPLPALAWDVDNVDSALQVYEWLYGKDPTIDVIRQTLPLVKAAELDVSVSFPPRAGAAAIPLMHWSY